LGYSEKPDINSWACGESLISKRFVITAASCEHLGNKDKPYVYLYLQYLHITHYIYFINGYRNNNIFRRFENWARIGELDYISETDHASPKDYKIIQRIIHPNYKSTSLYHYIALFRL